MAFDEKLADRIRSLLAKGHSKEFSEKKMFGGLAFMLGDKMCVGVLGDQLVARIGPEQAVGALKRPNVRPMDFTGRPLKGYVYVGPKAIRTSLTLKQWIDRSISFVSTLESKNRGSLRRKTVSQAESKEIARSTPLSKIINFGPATLSEFRAMGLTTFGQLEDLGWEAVCRKWVENFPERLNVNAFVGVIATFEGISWTKISQSDRSKARSLTNQLRREYALPPVRPSKRKRKI
ncbi:MAG: TfoX/Sxy family protein [Bdellovibrionota bacterium]